MEYLAKSKKTIFIGQAVEVPGTSMSNTLKNIKKNKLLELPVAEEMQMGITLGLAMDGNIPISIYPRWNFLLYAVNQLVNHIDKLNCPIILFQGAEDKIVPQSQANLMYESILSKGIPVSYLLFDGEQHGFRRPETIKRVLEAELYFYSRIFEFSAPQLHDPVHIYNLDPSHSQ